MALTKFKQQFAELFDKDKKTIDEGFDKRMRNLSEFELNVQIYYKNIQCFAQNTQGKQSLT